MIQFAQGSKFFIEDDKKVLFLVIDREEHFVTYATSIKEASDQLLKDKRKYSGHDFYIACYPIDLDEVVYLLLFSIG